MSRIGKQPITLPAGTQLQTEKEQVTIIGSKGTLIVPLVSGTELSVEGNRVDVSRTNDEMRAAQGLVRSLLQNAVTGVSKGWSKNLELNGVGMRAALSGSKLTLSLGFSHPVIVEAPAGITFTVVKNVITVSGIDKQLVGETSAKIRSFKKPEPYKGKGIKYSTEVIRRKAGKTGKAGK